MAAAFKACDVSGCNKNADHAAGGSLGFCRNHYIRFRRHGDPLGGRRSPEDGEAWLIFQQNYSGDECLIWPFGENKYYPSIRFRGRKTRVHRAMCEIVHGKPPSDVHEAAHDCGQGHNGCVTPGHLKWATPIANQADRLKHGTDGNGERHPAAKLTANDVKEIRRLKGKMLQREIGAMFGINQASVSDIQRGRSWRLTI